MTAGYETANAAIICKLRTSAAKSDIIWARRKNVWNLKKRQHFKNFMTTIRIDFNELDLNYQNIRDLIPGNFNLGI